LRPKQKEEFAPRWLFLTKAGESHRRKNMKMKVWGICAGLCMLAMMAATARPAQAQDEPKEKPPMYTYVGDWNIPRAQWAEM
jgi:hypothetical protein